MTAGEIRVLWTRPPRQRSGMKRRAAYVSPDFEFSGLGRIGKGIRFVRGFYPDWDNAYCAELMKAFHLSDRRQRCDTFIWRENEIKPAARARSPAAGADSRRTDHRP